MEDRAFGELLSLAQRVTDPRSHAYWRNPLFASRNNRQVRNVDSRAILAVRATDG